MTQNRAPRWLQDRAYRPRRPLLEPSWDVRVLHVASLLFTLAMLAIGLVLNPLFGPVVRMVQRRRWSR